MRILVWNEKFIKRVKTFRDKLKSVCRKQYYDIVNFVSYWKMYLDNKFFPKEVPLNVLHFTLSYKGKNVQVCLHLKNAKKNPNYIPTIDDFNIEQLVEDVDFQFKIHRAMNSLRSPPSEYEGTKGWSRRTGC
jgi:hypothetical protein